MSAKPAKDRKDDPTDHSEEHQPPKTLAELAEAVAADLAERRAAMLTFERRARETAEWANDWLRRHRARAESNAKPAPDNG